jgi:glutaminyl-peptide cyclotransferase
VTAAVSARRRRRTRQAPRRRVLPRAVVVASGVAAAVLGLAYAMGEPQSAQSAQAQRPAAAPTYGYDVVAEYPHDPQAFTQGLIYRDGLLYESTGLNGRSSLRQVRVETGEVIRRRDIEPRYFAEGLTEWDGRLVQLTYQSNIGFVYDLATFEPRGTFDYQGEGWGLTRDARHLIMSDGTSRLRFLDPHTFADVRRVEVTDGGRAVDDLNELEYVNGAIYANVWYLDRLAIVDPADGRVTGWVDLHPLLSRMTPPPDTAGGAVLNGIAYDAGGDRLFVTGKLWPRLFEIRVRLPR